MRSAILLALAAMPAVAAAQSTPARSILTPSNPIDRATAATDQRAADARRAADSDRASASQEARTAPPRSSAVPNSTFTDGASGFGTSPADSASTPTTPPR